MKTSFTSFENCGKCNAEFLQKHIVFFQNELLSKDEIIKAPLETPTAMLNKLAEQKNERNDVQQRSINSQIK